ncbi:hypothetical protein [Bdellovibrio sp. NC01]|uniref:hypothetical protein n=1 Tax=Bdellovibrio sp. NC01 TaxID=2220073 RepID=UPI00115B5353|nr:hypothetical protein [Bdellovibrio sp. NC01]QDK36185.1 hypothetical protein DOE51_00490 [Bdellovibrio sp. NC01]
MKYSKCVSKYLIFFAFCSLLACSSSDYSNPAPAAPDNNSAAQKPVYNNIAEGLVNGRSWKFVSGKASLFKRNGKFYLEVKLWNEVYSDPCNQYFGSTYQIRLYAENKVGEGKIDPGDPFNLIPTIIFSDLTSSGDYRNNMVASEGVIHVQSMANGRVVGAVQGNFRSSSVGRTEVIGNFDVPFCESKRASN